MRLLLFAILNLIQGILSTNNCPLEQPSCENYNYVCPKLTEITTCNGEGIEGYTTFRLSVIIKDKTNIKNIYAVYGNGEGEPLHLPPAYQSSVNYGSNIGGVNPFFISTYPDTAFDSWLTIGLTNGDINNKLSSIGIDFKNWDEEKSMDITDGAIFLMDPSEIIIPGNEYILGQITVRQNSNPSVVLNIQGKTNIITGPMVERTWNERSLRFDLLSPQIDESDIPSDCIIWFNGCNTCMVDNGNIDICTDLECSILENPGCLRYGQNGH